MSVYEVQTKKYPTTPKSSEVYLDYSASKSIKTLDFGLLSW